MRLIALAVAALAVCAAPAAALPDGYGYEMVSPPDKNGSDVGAGGLIGQYFASPDGDHLAYNSLGGWGDAPSNGVTGAYAATRGAESWSSTSLLVGLAPAAYGQLAIAAASAISNDFSTSLATSNFNQETGEVAAGFGAHFTYLMNVSTREIELFSIPDRTGNSTYGIRHEFLAGNEDFSRIVYTAGADLLGDGLSPSGSRVFLYDHGAREQVSVLPNGNPMLGRLGEAHRRPVSTEADVAYFIGEGPNPGLFRRAIEAGETYRVNTAESSADPPPPPAAATFAGASADGDVAYFVSNQQLVDEDADGANDLYRYDHSQPVGERLTLISVDSEPADGEGLVQLTHGVSADGETVMFTADNQLVAGGPTDPGSKLYAWSHGELRYVAPSDLTAAFQADRSTKLAEDGETFAFVSALSGITPDDNGGEPQVYVYDVAGDEIACASCNPDGPNTAAAELMRPVGFSANNIVTAAAPRRVVSDEGHVFFTTAERLVSQDTNGETDVYVWQDGELDLISTGRSSDDSWFLDASVDGSSVFFLTRQRLVGRDVDDNLDAYVARTGGVHRSAPAVAPPCTGDDCQPAAPTGPTFEQPGSSAYSAPKNASSGPDCRAAEDKAARAKRQARRKARRSKALMQRARAESGRTAERLQKRARRARKQAKQAKRRAMQAERQVQSCRRGR